LKESESKRRDESKFIDLGGLDGSGAGDLIIPDGDFVQEKVKVASLVLLVEIWHAVKD